MKNLVLIYSCDKLFYVSPGTEVDINKNGVRFIPSKDSFVFVDEVIFYGWSSYDKKEKEMSGSIKTRCRNIDTGEEMECNLLIWLKDGRFTFKSLNSDTNEYSIMNMEPIASTYLVEKLIEENPDIEEWIKDFLMENPKCLSSIGPYKWKNWGSSIIMDEFLKDDMIEDYMQGYFGVSIGKAALQYINNNNDKYKLIK